MVVRTITDRSDLRGRFDKPEEYVGYWVHDPEGRRLGRVKELFANAYGEPEYVRVKMGLFGLKAALIPIGFVTVDEQQRILTLQ